MPNKRTLSLAAILVLSSAFSATHGRQFQLTVVGCFIDLTTGGRDIKELKDFRFNRFGNVGMSQGTYDFYQSNMSIYSTSMTHQLCGNICALGGFQFIGLQAVNWCFCGNSYGSQGTASINDCNTGCAGNGSQNCGANYRNYVLKLTYIFLDQFVLGNRALVGIGKPDAPAFRTVGARGLADCAFLCSVGCEAMVFNGEQGLCHLLEYAIFPAVLNNDTSSEFFVRQ